MIRAADAEREQGLARFAGRQEKRPTAASREPSGVWCVVCGVCWSRRSLSRAPVLPLPAVRTPETEDACRAASATLLDALVRLHAQAVFAPLRQILAVDPRVVGLQLEFRGSRRALEPILHLQWKRRVHRYRVSPYEILSLTGTRGEDEALSSAQKSTLQETATALQEALRGLPISGLRDEVATFLEQRVFELGKNALITPDRLSALHRSVAGEAAYDAWEAEQRARTLDEGLPAAQGKGGRLRV